MGLSMDCNGKMTKFRILSEEDLDMVISVPKWPVYRRARLYVHLWKIARLTPVFLCARLFVILCTFRALLCCLGQLNHVQAL